MQSSACFERVLRCVVFQLAVCMLCVCVCVHILHGHTCCRSTLFVGDSACKAGCQHCCIDKEVEGEIWLPKYWHLVVLWTFLATLLLLYLVFWYFT